MKKSKTKKKAQVGIEVLVILGIFVIGAVILGVYYVNSISNTEANAPAISDSLDEFERQVNYEGAADVSRNNISSPPFVLSLSSSPSSTILETNMQFQIDATINYSTVNQIKITKILVTDMSDTGVAVCKYGSITIPDTGYTTNISLGYTDPIHTKSLSGFSCITDGQYKFIIEIKEDDTEKTTTQFITKTIINPPTPFALLLSLDPVGSTQVINPFIIKAEVQDYEATNPVIIKKITVTDSDGAVDNCSYDGTPIPAGGLEPTINNSFTENPVNKYSKDLIFSCSHYGDYIFKIDAGESGTNASGKNDDASENKEITPIPFVLSPLSLVDSVETKLSETFKIEVKIDNYIITDDTENIIIKKIIITKEESIYNNQCYLGDGTVISANGDIPGITMNKENNNYSYILEFLCTEAGNYKFEITAGESGTTHPLLEDTESLDKTIQPSETCNFSEVSEQIWCLEDLNAVRNQTEENYYLMRDLDFDNPSDYRDPATNKPLWTTTPGWIPIGTIVSYGNDQSFTKNFYGNNHKIKNLYINRGSSSYVLPYIGLFGTTSNSAKIYNLGLINVNIFGADNCKGAFVGYHRGVIDNCYSTGTLSSTNSGWNGGFVGCNLGQISNSYADVNVSGSNTRGGFVGTIFNDSSNIVNSYSIGLVSDSGTYIQGFAGSRGITSITNSFWDTTTSGQSNLNGPGVTGLPTEEMVLTETYEAANWDIGTENSIWARFDGINNGYPYLRLNIPD